MGRVKLQIKKIENTTNRQVTYSKRRNGLLKKAYELSVLCDVDVALIMFSPSGRVSLFSGNNKGIEDVFERYANLPEHERGRLQNQDYLNRLISKLKEEADQNRQASPDPESADSQLEDLQEELKTSKTQLEEIEKRLSIFESDPSEITTLDEVHYREHVLEETLKQIRMRKQVLEGNYECHGISQPSTQVQIPSAEHMHITGLVNRDAHNVFEWFPQRDPQVQVLNFLDSNGLLPQREQTHHHCHQGVGRMIMPPLNLLSGGSMINMEEHMSRSHRSSATEEVENENNNNDNDNNRVRAQGQASTSYGQAVDVNLSPWANHHHQFYPSGNDHALPSEQPRERALLELFLSQFTP